MTFFLLNQSKITPTLPKFTKSFGRQFNWKNNHINSLSRRVDNQELWSPAKKNNLYCFISGRLAFEESEWLRSKSLDIKGGLASRLIIDYWVNNRKNFYLKLNGAGTIILIIDNQINIITDRLGMMPIFSAVGKLGISSHSDLLAYTLSKQNFKLSLDKHCIAEFLSYGSSIEQRTYYSEIKQLKNGYHYTFDTSGKIISKFRYWKPKALNRDLSKKEKINNFYKAIKKAVSLRTHTFIGKPGVLLSSGADSRAVLCAMENPKTSLPMTIYQYKNDELKFSKKITKKLKTKHLLLKREANYYAKYAKKIITITGGRWSFIDGHYIGFANSIKKNDIGVIFSGCYCDYLFKGLSQNKKNIKLFGKPIPIFIKDKFNFTSYIDKQLISTKWQKKIDLSFSKIFKSKIGSLPDHFNRENHEFIRNFPLSREPDSSGRSILRLLLPFDYIFSDNQVIDSYLSLSVDEKLNSSIFEKTVKKICDDHKVNVLNNNFKSPIGYGSFIKLIFFLSSVFFRKIKKIFDPNKKPKDFSEGTWPTWDKYFVNSKDIKDLWKDPSPNTLKLIEEILGENPWKYEISYWTNKNTHFFSRILTLKLWLENEKTKLIFKLNEK